MPTNGSVATTTGWQLSTTGAAGAASSTTENKKQRVSVVDATDSSGTPATRGKGKGKGKTRTRSWGPWQQHRVWEATLSDTYLISSTAPIILAAKEAGRFYHLEKECHSGSPGRNGTPSRTGSSRVDHLTGVSPESNGSATRSTGYFATTGAVAVQRDSRRGGRSCHSHEGLPDLSDRHLSVTSENRRRKPPKCHPRDSLRHGRQTYDRYGSTHTRDGTCTAHKSQPTHPNLTLGQPQIVFSRTMPPVSQFWSQVSVDGGSQGRANMNVASLSHDVPRFLVPTVGRSAHFSVGRSYSPLAAHSPDLTYRASDRHSHWTLLMLKGGISHTSMITDHPSRILDGWTDHPVRMSRSALGSSPLVTVLTSRALDGSTEGTLRVLERPTSSGQCANSPILVGSVDEALIVPPDPGLSHVGAHSVGDRHTHFYRLLMKSGIMSARDLESQLQAGATVSCLRI